MTPLAALIPDPATAERCAWTLLHSLWQGIILLIILWLALRALRQASTQSRYVVLCLGLVALVLSPAVTFFVLAGKFDDPGPIVLMARSIAAADTSAASTLAGVVRAYSDWVVAVWFAGTTVASLWHLGSWLWLHRVLLRASTPMREGWEGLIALAARIGVPAVRFLESELTDVPITFGWLKPVVLMPPAALTGLTVEQVEAIVAHELAHVLRQDYLINLLQAAAETALFYNPVVWWVSHRLREEREHCCDDIAARVGRGPVAYGRALVALEEQRHAMAAPLAMAATAGPLMRRIARLLESRSGTAPARRPLVSSAVGITLVLVGAALLLASSAVARPVRPVQDVRSLAAQVYALMDVRGGTGSAVPALGEALAALRGGSFNQEVALRLARDLHDAPMDELGNMALAAVSLDDPMLHERRSGWRCGHLLERVRIAHELRGAAYECRGTSPADARLLARGAMLLHSQDSLFFGSHWLHSMLDRDDEFAIVAGFDARQTARLRRHIEDHRAITAAFVALIRHADAELDRVGRGGSPVELQTVMRRMAPLARQRPDIQWCIANLRRRHMALTTVRNPAADAAFVAELAAYAPASSHFARWLNDDSQPAQPTQRFAKPLTHEELARFRKVASPMGARPDAGKPPALP